MDLADGIPVSLHLETHVFQDEDVTRHVFDETGQLIQVGTSIYLRYQETSEDDGTKIPVTIKIGADDSIQITRGDEAAQNRSRLYFMLNRRVLARYQTPYGEIPVTTVTPHLEIKLRERPMAGEVNLDYQLFAEQQHLGDYKMRLIFTT